MSGTLYIVGTPIGNLGDFSPRAVETLSSVDFIAAEDTRVTLKLLNYFELKKPMISYFEHNKYERGEGILRRIEAGESCALVSDAGMPAISDPGELLIKQAAERGIPVLAVPGPSAVISALAVSGLPTGRFTFEGFLSVNKRSRREHLDSVLQETRTMVFYEAPHKLLATLRDLRDAFGGDRPIALVRELTKVHEEAFRTTLAQAVTYYQATPPKGEFVLVIGGAQKQEAPQVSITEAADAARLLIKNGSSLNEAAKQAAKQFGYKKNELYRLLTEKEEEDFT